MFIINLLQKLKQSLKQTDIEYYIESHNPKTTSDVEQLIQRWNYQRSSF
jgi:ferritin-like metal-binding protein YciE